MLEHHRYPVRYDLAYLAIHDIGKVNAQQRCPYIRRGVCDVAPTLVDLADAERRVIGDGMGDAGRCAELQDGVSTCLDHDFTQKLHRQTALRGEASAAVGQEFFDRPFLSSKTIYDGKQAIDLRVKALEFILCALDFILYVDRLLRIGHTSRPEGV